MQVPNDFIVASSFSFSFNSMSSSVSQTFPLGKRVMGFKVDDSLVFPVDEVVVDE